MTPTKHLPVGFNLIDWHWGPYEPCADYHRIAAFLEVDLKSPTGLRYHGDHKRAGAPAGRLDVCNAGTKRGPGAARARDYRRIRVGVGKCSDPWAPKKLRGDAYRSGAHGASVIWLLTTGNWPPPGLDVDHRDVDATHNDPRNIRLLDRSGNNRNRIRVLRKLDAIGEVAA